MKNKNKKKLKILKARNHEFKKDLEKLRTDKRAKLSNKKNTSKNIESLSSESSTALVK